VKLLNVYGKLVDRNVARYRVEWEGKSPSKLQHRVKLLLKPIWFAHVVFEEFPVFGSLQRLDFYNATKRIAVEVNGPQHDKIIPFFHGNLPQLGFASALRRDLNKYRWCERNNINVVEIIEADLSDIQGFYKRIQDAYNI